MSEWNHCSTAACCAASERQSCSPAAAAGPAPPLPAAPSAAPLLRSARPLPVAPSAAPLMRTPSRAALTDAADAAGACSLPLALLEMVLLLLPPPLPPWCASWCR
jgi:hypothetical protein